MINRIVPVGFTLFPPPPPEQKHAECNEAAASFLSSDTTKGLCQRAASGGGGSSSRLSLPRRQPNGQSFQPPPIDSPDHNKRVFFLLRAPRLAEAIYSPPHPRLPMLAQWDQEERRRGRSRRVTRLRSRFMERVAEMWVAPLPIFFPLPPQISPRSQFKDANLAIWRDSRHRVTPEAAGVVAHTAPHFHCKPPAACCEPFETGPARGHPTRRPGHRPQVSDCRRSVERAPAPIVTIGGESGAQCRRRGRGR